MRFIVLAAVPLLMALTTLAHPPLRRGLTTDTCANLDRDLVFPDVDGELSPPRSYPSEFQPDLGKSYNAGRMDIGLCKSQIPKIVGQYDVTEAAVKVVGYDRVEVAVTALVNTLLLVKYAGC